MFGAQKIGFISEVRETNSKWIKKLTVFPFQNRTIHGFLFGFAIGLYYCISLRIIERILEHDHDGELAKSIRRAREAK